MVRWFCHHARAGWATTALMQSAFVRIVSQPEFSGRSIAISEVATFDTGISQLLSNGQERARHLVVLDSQPG